MSIFNKTDTGELSGLSWEVDAVFQERASRKTAWMLVCGLFALVVVMAVTIMLLVPLKSTVPYVFTVDKATGEVTVASTIKDFVRNSELNDKFWVKRFVLAHERYSYRFIQNDYDTVQLLAGDNVFKAFASRYDGPNSPDKQFRDDIQDIPTILSISVTDGKLATVRFEKRRQDTRPGGAFKVTRWVALVRYEYKTFSMRPESELIENPLGFQVIGYQVDPEIDNSNGK